MYKYVSLRNRTENGEATMCLIGPDGRLIAGFTAFVQTLKRNSFNTRNSYCRHLAEFIDYVIEVNVVLAQGRVLTKMELKDALEAYGDYLRLGPDAVNPLARQIANTLPPGINKHSSVIPKMAAVRRFLSVSEEIRKEMLEIALLSGSQNTFIANEPLIPEIGKRRKITPAENNKLQANSMLAGVIAGGPKLIRHVALTEKADNQSYDELRAFPYDKVIPLIDSMPTYRDKAFYALLAASGCRTHECLQVLMSEDINVLEGTVRLVNPSSRPRSASYKFLTPEQRDKLAWKGRTTDLTLLIEPFASVFFDSLQKYLELEHIAHGKHDFLFQYHIKNQRGMPFFLSESTSRLELFHRINRRIGVKLPPRTGPHSLRHMYATYALNYFPRANGEYGLPAPIVQQLLGHTNIQSTLKYAKFDKDLLKLEIQNANKVLFQHGVSKTILELKVDALEAQLIKVRAQLVKECE